MTSNVPSKNITLPPPLPTTLPPPLPTTLPPTTPQVLNVCDNNSEEEVKQEEVKVDVEHTNRKANKDKGKRMLELFSGTHSIGKVAQARGMEVVSLDRDMKGEHKPSIQEDIMTWNYKKYSQGYFDIITASPVCLWWSSARNLSFGKEIKSHPGEKFTKEL